MKNEALFNEYAEDILNHELFLRGRGLVSHGAITIYEHCLEVAKLSFSMANSKFAGNTIDIKCIVRAALLHDFYLYEWHVPGKRYVLHGWVHAGIAAKNAREVFGITDKEYSCIKTHMWPWTPFHLPRCREAWIITLADKLIALKETVLHRGKRPPP